RADLALSRGPFAGPTLAAANRSLALGARSSAGARPSVHGPPDALRGWSQRLRRHRERGELGNVVALVQRPHRVDQRPYVMLRLPAARFVQELLLDFAVR